MASLFRLRLLAFGGCLLLLLLLPQLACPEETTYSDHAVEAAFLRHFGHFVTWPNDGNLKALNICLLTPAELRGVFLKIGTQSEVRGKSLRTTVIQGEGSEEYLECQILFISGKTVMESNRLLQRARKLPILTVSDLPGFAESGGIIEFHKSDNKLRFIINLAAAQKQGLTISSQLLHLASRVIMPNEPGAK